MNLIQIENKSGKVKLTDAVTPWSVEKLTDDIGKLFGAKALENGVDFTSLINAGGKSVDTLEIEINSPGGSIFDGYNIYNEILSLRERGVVVTATVTGMAASMASVICMACDTVRMVPHGRMMIHEASNGVHGNAEAHRKAAEFLDGISNDIATIYANHTKATTEKIRDLMKAETWMNAKESLASGFIDEIINSGTEKNSIDFAVTHTTSSDMKFLDRLTQPSDAEAQERIVTLESTIAQHDGIVQGYEDKLAIAENALAEVETLKAENLSLAGKVAGIADLENKIADLTAKVEITEEKISSAAAQKLAAQGHGEPLEITGNATIPEKEIKALTGLAKVQAAFKAQNVSKSNSN
jgi:ATP-dependent Clp endopeptidase proteolytic subunit ClpP